MLRRRRRRKGMLRPFGRPREKWEDLLSCWVESVLWYDGTHAWCVLHGVEWNRQGIAGQAMRL